MTHAIEGDLARANDVGVPSAGLVTEANSATYGDVVVSPDSSTAYISVPNKNEVAVLNLATGLFATPIPVGTTPEGLDITANGATLYVCDSGSGTISVVNVATATVTGTIKLAPVTTGEEPWQIALGDNGTAVLTTTFATAGLTGHAYLLNLTSDTTAVLTGVGVSGAVTELARVVRSADYSTAAIDLGDEAAGAFYVYNFITGTVVSNTLNDSVSYLALNGNGTMLMVGGTSATYVINATTGALLGTIALAAYGIAIDASGATAYVESGSSIEAINLSNDAGAGTTSLPGGASGQLVLTPDGTTLVALDGSGVSIIPVSNIASTTSGTIRGTVSTASGAFAGVCVFAQDESDQSDENVYSALSTSNGAYVITGLPPGLYFVSFDPTCAGEQTSTYAIEYYRGAIDPVTATLVGVAVGQTTSDINAVLPVGGTVSGIVTAPSSLSNGDICVFTVSSEFEDGETFSVADEVALTGTSGAYTVANIPPGNYSLFFDPTCLGLISSDYSSAYYTTSQFSVAAGANLGPDDGSLEPDSFPTFSTTSLATATVSSPYSTTLTASGGTGVYSYTTGSLPPGLSFNPATSTISGTPTLAGSYTVQASVYDFGSNPTPVVTASFNLVVSTPVTPAAVTTTTTAPIVTTTTTTIAPVTTTTTAPATTTTLAPKQKLVCTVETRRAVIHKVEIRNGISKTITIHRIVDVTKRVAIHVFKKVHGKRERVTVYRFELVKHCTLVTS